MAEIDNNLDIRLRTCARNATYTSKTTQNELLSCIKDYIQSEIVADINNQIRGPYYGISADEVTDCSNWEQLGILLRYVKDSVAVEKLIEYVKCHNIKGNTITKLIIDTVTNVGLKNSLCRSQTYDGDGNMSGKQKGALNQFCEITGSKKQCIFIVHPMNSICTYQKRRRFQRYTTWYALCNP